MAAVFLVGYAIPPLVRDRLASPVPFTKLQVFAPRRTEKGGGGGRSRSVPREGQIPQRPMRRAFLPPMAAIDNPALPLEVAMLDGPDVRVAPSEVGDPLSRFKGRDFGSHGIDGMGNIPGGGYGPNAGFKSVAAVRQPRVTRPPQLIYRPEPEYSEEARKARFQGSVVLAVEIGLDGRASKIRVVRAAGLGLDEKAIEAVERWRFIPALEGDKPVAAPALIEVAFHLL